MLNELYDVAQCLQAARVTMASRHRHFKDCGKGTAYFALIDKDGGLVRLDRIKDQGRQKELRKWMVSEGDSFPAFNVVPLLKPRNDKVRDKVAAFKKRLASKRMPQRQWTELRLRRLLLLAVNGWINPTKSDKGRDEHDKVGKCLSVVPHKFGEILGVAPSEFRAISDLVDRANKTTADRFHDQLKEWIIRQVLEAPTTSYELLDLLFFHSGTKPKPVSLILELADQSQFEFPANHKAVYAWIISRLIANDGAQPAIGRDGPAPTVDAYGRPAERIGDKFPEVRLDFLGKVKLRAMNKESPCQFRYGVAESRSFPVGATIRDEMSKALLWIGDPHRRGKTFCDVSSFGGKIDLLFAYPAEKPDLAPEIAGLIVGYQDDIDPDGARFEACASRVTASLTRLAHETPAAEVRIFVLTKPDGRRTKVLHSTRYSVQRLLESADQWKLDCRNVPSVKLRRCGVGKGDKPFWAGPLIPYPGELIACLNTAWQRSGTYPKSVPSFGIADGLGLLLERGPMLDAIVGRAVRTLVSQSSGFVLAIGLIRHDDDRTLVKNRHPALTRREARLLPSILGLLLAKLGRSKGEYMRGPAFLVGRLLNLADQLHVEYCLDERKGQIASLLLGSALMPTALEQPEKALALLCQRLPPYKNWATRLQSGDRVGLVKFFLGEMGRLCSQLKESTIPKSADDADKAEMLLGYLASSETTSETTTTNSGGSA